MNRKIIKIDREKCNGCGACAAACHEGAIDMIDGKAVLTRENYCDGLGDCLPACPTGAITFEEREAPAYDEAAVLAAKKAKEVEPEHSSEKSAPLPCGCPGTKSHLIRHDTPSEPKKAAFSSGRLMQWPVQIKLVPVGAPYFENADLLIAADCSAYAYGNFHEDYIRGRITLIGCPKLDEGDYTEKLTAILSQNSIRTVTVTRIEVPCCGGIERAVNDAVKACGKNIPVSVHIIGTDGEILSVKRAQ